MKGGRRHPGREFLEWGNSWQQEGGCRWLQASQACLGFANQPQLSVSSEMSDSCVHVSLWKFIHSVIFDCTGSSLLQGFSLVVESGGSSLSQRSGFLPWWLLLSWSRALERRLRSWGAGAQMLCGMWDRPRPGMEPTSPALQVGPLPLSHRGSPEGSLIHLPLAVRPLMRDLLWPAVSSVSSGPRVQPPASGPPPPLAVVATLVHSGRARVFRRWKEPICAMLPPRRYGVARCQHPQEDKKHPDHQLPSYHRGWPAFVRRSPQRDEERGSDIPGLAGEAICNLALPTAPGKSHTCLVTLTFLCLSPLWAFTDLCPESLSPIIFTIRLSSNSTSSKMSL